MLPLVNELWTALNDRQTTQVLKQSTAGKPAILTASFPCVSQLSGQWEDHRDCISGLAHLFQTLVSLIRLAVNQVHPPHPLSVSSNTCSY